MCGWKEGPRHPLIPNLSVLLTGVEGSLEGFMGRGEEEVEGWRHLLLAHGTPRALWAVLGWCGMCM